MPVCEDSKTGFRQAIFIVLVLMAVVLFLLWRYQDNPPRFSSHPDVAPLSSLSLPVMVQQPLHIMIEKKPTAARNVLIEELQGTSLAGTDIDRSMLHIENGKLVLNGGLLFYFDYFLTLEGEMPMEDIRQMVWRDLQVNYDEVVAEQIFGLFERYLGYLKEVAGKEASVTSEQVIAQHLSARDMQDGVKHQYFSETEIAALFDNYDAMLARPSQASIQQEKYEKYQQVIQEHPQQLESVATEFFGASAAQNLRNVQYQRQQWAGRVAHYEREKQATLKVYANDQAGQLQALALLQQRLFSELEIRRVRALERIAGGEK